MYREYRLKHKLPIFVESSGTTFNRTSFCDATRVLENAPSIYLASISGLNGKTPIQVQNEIVDQFPNISVIDVTKINPTLIKFIQSN